GLPASASRPCGRLCLCSHEYSACAATYPFQAGGQGQRQGKPAKAGVASSRPFQNPTGISPGSEFPVSLLRFLLCSRNIDRRSEKKKNQRRRRKGGGGEVRGILRESGFQSPPRPLPPLACPGARWSLSRMSTEAGELLGIDPIELRFPFELNKQISCTLHLTNKTDKQVAFKVKTTSPKKYCVRPNNGIVAPRSTADVVVTMQAQREAPLDMQCKDKFLVQSAIVAKEIMPKEVTGDMFIKESGNVVDEVKLKVVYITPSTQSEGFEDGSPGSLNYQEPFALIAKLMEEKNSAVELNNKLRQELDLLRRDISRQHGGFSLVLVLVVAIMGILLGLLMKR
ncbi:unnamed protein product, partial [Urochloa humidicola]